jgi:hypothetical protein
MHRTYVSTPYAKQLQVRKLSQEPAWRNGLALEDEMVGDIDAF